jgi:hypothetical protein
MDQSKHSISPNELYARLGTDAAPIIVDVRRETDFAGADTLVADAIEQPGVEATEDRFPLAISKTAPLKNVEVSLRLETTGGTSDRDGGFALRLRTPNNYYLVKLDALRDRVLFLLVADGVPKESRRRCRHRSAHLAHPGSPSQRRPIRRLTRWHLGVHGIRQNSIEAGPHRTLDQGRQRHALRPDRDRIVAMSPQRTSHLPPRTFRGDVNPRRFP